jgi:hypothetical protein
MKGIFIKLTPPDQQLLHHRDTEKYSEDLSSSYPVGRYRLDKKAVLRGNDSIKKPYVFSPEGAKCFVLVGTSPPEQKVNSLSL